MLSLYDVIVQDPEAHKWTKPMTFKKKVFCNVCRKKISSHGVFCEGKAIIDVLGYIHIEQLL